MKEKTRRGDSPVSPRLPIPASLFPLFCGVAKLVRHRTVTAAMRRFESFRHSQICNVDPELEWQSSGLLSREVRV
jgi:hypothetical protein